MKLPKIFKLLLAHKAVTLATLASVGTFITIIYQSTEIAAKSVSIIKTIFVKEKTPPPENLILLEILLDRSDSMTYYFDGLTRWEAARGILLDNIEDLKNSSDLSSLRCFGGFCDDATEYKTSQIVGFKANNYEDIENALNKIKPDGESTLYQGIKVGINDFESVEVVNPRKKLKIIVGGISACKEHYNFKDVRERLNEKGILTSVQIIGMDLTDSIYIDLKAFLDSLHVENKRIDNVTDMEGFKNAIRELPVHHSLPAFVQKLIRERNEIANNLNEIKTLSNSRKISDAKISIKRINTKVIKLENDIQDKGTKKVDVGFRLILYLSKQSLDLHRGFIKIADDYIQILNSEHSDDLTDIRAREKFFYEWEKLIIAYSDVTDNLYNAIRIRYSLVDPSKIVFKSM